MVRSLPKELRVEAAFHSREFAATQTFNLRLPRGGLNNDHKVRLSGLRLGREPSGQDDSGST
jgi:hypothetical protein